MVGQTPTDTPFGLAPNTAAGLAYLLSVVGGIVMLAGGGTNKFVKWAACQSITYFIVCMVVRIALQIVLGFMPFLWPLALTVYMVLNLVFFIGWIYTVITAFQGKEVELPIVGGFTRQIFASQLA